MGKMVHPDVLDSALGFIRTHTLQMCALPGQPANYAAAIAARLAQVAMDASHFTLAAGDTSGRKLTIAARTGVAVSAAGTATHIALIDTTNARLVYVTTCPDQNLVAGGSVDFAEWTVEIGDPV